jgi:prophage antirepressor-like protein
MNNETNALQTFFYNNKEVRTLWKDGEPWWVLKDVCDVLEIGNSRDVATRLHDDEKGVDLIDTLGGAQKLTIINESGLYNVILRSDKPEADRFRRWITHEVLPSIRKHEVRATPVAAQIKEKTDPKPNLGSRSRDETKKKEINNESI